MQNRYTIYANIHGVSVTELFYRGDDEHLRYMYYNHVNQGLIDIALEDIKTEPIERWVNRRKENRGAGNKFLVSRIRRGKSLVLVPWALQDGRPVALAVQILLTR